MRQIVGLKTSKKARIAITRKKHIQKRLRCFTMFLEGRKEGKFYSREVYRIRKRHPKRIAISLARAPARLSISQAICESREADGVRGQLN